MSRDRLRELMKKHKESRNERLQKRTSPELEVERFTTIAPTPKPTNISSILSTPNVNINRNPFTPLVMPDKLDTIINGKKEEEKLTTPKLIPSTPVVQATPQVIPPTPKPVVQATPQVIPPTPVVQATPQLIPPTPKPVVQATPQVIPPTPKPVVQATPQLIPPTPKPVVQATPQVIPPTPKPVVQATPQVIPPTPKPVVQATPQVIPPTPKPVVQATPQVIPPTPKPVVQATPQVIPPTSVENQDVPQTNDIKEERLPVEPVEDGKEKSNYKTLWVKLIKKSNCTALSSDVIDGCRDLMEEIVKECCETLKDSKELDVQSVQVYIHSNIKNQVGEIDKDCVFPQNTFLKCIQHVLDTCGVTIRTDSVFVLQTFVEYLIVKMLNGAELVKEASKRKRVFATDLLISYQIYKM